MAAITISRDHGYADSLRAYAIVLDGKTIGQLRGGESKELPVVPGQHDLAVRVDWCGSNSLRFTVAEGEIAVFRVTSSLRGWRILLAVWHALFAWDSYLRLVRVAVSFSSKFSDRGFGHRDS